MCLNEERGVPDPGDADLALADFRELRTDVIAGAFREKRRYQDFGEEIALMPIGSRTQANTRGALRGCAISRGLANNISPTFSRKTNWHDSGRI